MSIVWSLLDLFGKNSDVAQLEIRVQNLEEDEILYEVWEGIGTSSSGQVTVYTQSAVIFSRYEDGMDAICVQTDTQGRPIDQLAKTSSGAPIQVSSFDSSGNYTLTGTPASDSAIIYFLKIQSRYKSNIPLDKIADVYDVDDGYAPVPSREIVASENLVSGNFVNIWLDGATLKARRADATSISTRAHGFVLNSFTSGTNAYVYFDLFNVLSGLTPGSIQYLSTSPGAVTETPPTGSGNIVQQLGVATATNEMYVEISQPVILY